MSETEIDQRNAFNQPKTLTRCHKVAAYHPYPLNLSVSCRLLCSLPPPQNGRSSEFSGTNQKIYLKPETHMTHRSHPPQSGVPPLSQS